MDASSFQSPDAGEDVVTSPVAVPGDAVEDATVTSRSNGSTESAAVPSAPTSDAPWVNVMGSRHFLDWLAETQISLGFTTYQTGKLFFIGRKPDNAISVFERTFNHCMGLWASPDGSRLWMSSKFQLWQFQRAGAQAIPHQSSQQVDGDAPPVPAWTQRGYDVAYVPRAGYTTGDLDVHDVAVDADGRVIFVTTLFGCLATISDEASFTPLWRPPFLSALVPEDRCHLNGLAMRDGKPTFVTVVSRSDVVDGWRDRRQHGGCVLSVPEGEVVCEGLSMPHSPRWYRDKLWVLNSGCGEFGYVDLESGKFEPVAFCPGYMRGLAFVGDYAIVTISKPRHVTFHGLPLDERLKEKEADAQCGLQIIDLRTGAIAHWVRLDGSLVTELYDAVVLQNCRQPMAIGFQTNEIERLLVVGEEQPL